MTRPPTTREVAELHPATVTSYSRGQVVAAALLPPPRGHRRRRDLKAQELLARTIPAPLLASSTAAAGGDPNRLWFTPDGAVWILNHTRATRCASPACPACKGATDDS